MPSKHPFSFSLDTSVISIATMITIYHQSSSPKLTATFSSSPSPYSTTSSEGWIDWNLLVDFEGGPNHLGNMCDAPIVTLEDFSDVHVQPKYYYFGHISKYVPPGSVRVESHTVGECGHRFVMSQMRCDEIR
jgi:Glycosyl hydrolase family 30 TIM-barrel domain